MPTASSENRPVHWICFPFYLLLVPLLLASNISSCIAIIVHTQAMPSTATKEPYGLQSPDEPSGKFILEQC
ncbi:hypothetical protein MJO29_000169 [Puccinia striiformis f. sp. tritici]|nr:hypothetical protein MJO29_000169 [Puccinia striiformis f. sp. tritici]